MTRLQRWAPWACALAAVVLVVGAIAGSAGRDDGAGMPVEAIARLPVSASGRVKPLDTFARAVLLRASGRRTYDANGRRAPAIEWLLEAWTDRDASMDRRVFRIDHPDVLSMIGFDDPGRTRFSFRELQPSFGEIMRQAQMASGLSRTALDPFQRHVLELYAKLAEYSSVLSLETPYAVPPLTPGQEWRPLSRAGPDASSAGFGEIIAAYASGDTMRTRRAVASYQELLASTRGRDVRASRYEVLFNRCEPFFNASVLYVVALLLGFVSLLLRPASPKGWAPSLARAALLVLAVAFVVHTIGLGSRIYLQGRPPVTNLYSSAVFIGWAVIPIAMIGEWFSRLGLLQLVAALIGFATLVIAHNLGGRGDTMEMMQAVLDSNFWLATHVVVVTIGYSATFLAGFLACLYVVGGVLTRLLTGEPAKALPKMIYGVICFACVASFVGTVLGGIWADQSWGRFWGWDPKENGAALIVIWNLLILHARWGGMIRDRGVAALAVGGNIITAWSWFGTNMLGVGLHSYGFTESAAFWLIVFCVSQLAIIALALTPTSRWRSLAGGRTTTTTRTSATSATPTRTTTPSPAQS